MNRILIVTACVLHVLFMAPAWSHAEDRSDLETAQAEGSKQLAERFAEMSQSALRGKKVTELDFKQATALIHAACRLAPDEPRFARLLVDSMLNSHDTEGAINALVEYRKLVPEDRTAQLKLIDLYVARFETLEARLEYLKDVISRPGIPDEVRSHAAIRAAKLHLERSQDSVGEALLAQSLRFNPLNIEALSLQVTRAQVKGAPLEKANAMLQSLKANPAQPGICLDLARLCASLGLMENSVQWYQQGLSLGQRVPYQFGSEDVSGYLAAMYVGDQAMAADQISKTVVKANEGDVNTHLVRLLIARVVGRKDEIDLASTAAGNVLSNRLAEVRKFAGQSSATTQPVSSPTVPAVPDLSGDSTLLEKSSGPALTAYVNALCDWAWFKIYFERDAEGAGKLLAGLRPMLPQDSVTVARLDGWLDLISNRPEDAQKKLQPVAEKDPLAMAGLIRILSTDPAQLDASKSMARKTLSDNTGGILGAILTDALRDVGGKIIVSDAGEAVRAEIQKFPMEWFTIIDKPRGFYGVHIEPTQPTYMFREPMIAKISINNYSPYDLTIGPEGVIHPDLWFDAKVKGVSPRDFIGCAFDRLAFATVLHAQESLTQYVRIDRGDLYAFLSGNPTISMNVEVSVTMNPTMGPAGLGYGPAGERETTRQNFARLPFPMNTDQAAQNAFTLLQTGSPREKLAMVETLSVYAMMFRNKEAPEQMKAAGIEFADRVGRARLDKISAVSAWSMFVSVFNGRQEDRNAMAERLISSDLWFARCLGVFVTPTLPADRRTSALETLAKDADATVASLAQVALLEPAPTTQPAAADSVPAAPPAGAGAPPSTPMPQSSDILLK